MTNRIKHYRAMHGASRLRLNRGRRFYARLVFRNVCRDADPRVAHWDAAHVARTAGLWSPITANGDCVHGLARHWWKLFGNSSDWYSFHPFLEMHGLECRYQAKDIRRWRAQRDDKKSVPGGTGYVENWPGAL